MDDLKEKAYDFKKFLFITISTAVVFLLINLAVMAFTVGMQTERSARLCTPIKKRIDIGSQIEEQKVVLIGGSGVRAGFSAELLSKNMDIRAFNFGLQAALGLEVILFEAKKILRPGDTAVLVFEYNQFIDHKWNDVRLSYAFGCATDWFGTLSFSDKITALLAVELKRLYEVISYGTGTINKSQSENNYGNKFGDREKKSFPKLSDEQKYRLSLYQPLQFNFTHSSDQASVFKDFVSYAKEKDIKVIVSWPNTIRHEEYQKLGTFSSLESFFESLGLQIIGKPSLGLYPVTSFYDTQYHLNYDAIKVRTEDFIEEINKQDISLLK
ncbi:hypothetical protein [Candidatus Enterovibrio escicola]|uniref:hypothetical protein n=1 Tax=Candidatus Enterovibrio escicola TaxID=1927127 RepID=UPI00123822E6|nr:hypothetical protein [Candidatus Enterovibrio escacola]